VANITAPARYFARSGSARTEHFQIDVITVPRIESVRFRMTPPAYTIARRSKALPQTALRACRERWCRSGRRAIALWERVGSVGSASATGRNAGRRPSTQPALAGKLGLSPVDGSADEVTGSFVLSASGRLNLGVTDSQGSPRRKGLPLRSRFCMTTSRSCGLPSRSPNRLRRHCHSQRADAGRG